MKTKGRPKKMPAQKANRRLIFRLAEDLWQALQHEARQQDRTLSNMIVRILSQRYRKSLQGSPITNHPNRRIM